MLAAPVHPLPAYTVTWPDTRFVSSTDLMPDKATQAPHATEVKDAIPSPQVAPVYRATLAGVVVGAAREKGAMRERVMVRRD